jgi:hypothetical protein
MRDRYSAAGLPALRFDDLIAGRADQKPEFVAAAAETERAFRAEFELLHDDIQADRERLQALDEQLSSTNAQLHELFDKSHDCVASQLAVLGKKVDELAIMKSESNRVYAHVDFNPQTTKLVKMVSVRQKAAMSRNIIKAFRPAGIFSHWHPDVQVLMCRIDSHGSPPLEQIENAHPTLPMKWKVRESKRQY